MRKIASIKAASELIKVASTRLRELDDEVKYLREQVQHYEQMNKAASLAKKMADRGLVDSDNVDAQATMIYSNPQKMGAIEEAMDLLNGGGSFKIATLSDEQGRATTARSALESYLIGNEL